MATKNIEPTLESIKEYLEIKASEVFSIPPYQRAYSWTTDQCDKLWQDIETYREEGQEDPYFFGTIILDCSDPEGKKLDLIDGQQRTTSFLILLKALQLKIAESLQEIDNPKNQRDPSIKGTRRGLQRVYDDIMGILYKADSKSLVYIEDDWNNAKGITIIKNNSINELYKNDLVNLIEAKDYDEALRSATIIKYKRKDNKYTNFFKNFKFFYSKLGENRRDSWLLGFAEDFLNKCQVIVIKSWNIEQAIGMFNSLNSTGMPLSDADIISAQLYSHYGDKTVFENRWRSIIENASKLELEKIVNIDSVLQEAMYILRTKNKEYREGQVTTPGVRRYYLTEHIDRLKKPEDLISLFENILSIWEQIKNYPSIRLLSKFNENFKFFLITYLQRYEVNDITEEEIRTIVESLLKLFAVLELVDSGYSSSRFKTFLFNENFKLVDKDYPMESIESDFRNHIDKTWGRDAIKEALLDYSGNALVYLNEYLYATSKKKPFSLDSTVNIEHIMPSSGRNLDQIRIDAGIKDKDEFTAYANKLGNKILLEESINKALGNDWFRTKKAGDVSSKNGYIGSKYPLAESLSHYPEDLWTKEDIDIATEKVANRILNFIFS